MNEAEQTDGNSGERTPKMVLRAMLRAYVDAATNAERLYLRAKPGSVDEANADGDRDMFWNAAESIRGELAWLLEHDSLADCLEWPKWVDDDYRARLRGDCPIDAVP